MTAIEEVVTNKQKRVCRWLTLNADRLLRLGVGATLEIVVTRANGKVVSDAYYVTPIRDPESGERVGWELLKSRDCESLERHVVDTTFGDDPARNWACTCRDYEYRANPAAGRSCKHCLALGSALRWLGISNDSRQM